MRILLSSSVAVIASFVFARPAVGEAAPEHPINVILLTVDTLRPDALGWVAGRNATPEIDALAGEGFRFPAAVSPAPVTLPAHASLLTALIPRRHGVRDNGQVLGSAPPTLAEHLSSRGYATAAFISGYPLAAEFGLDRGFAYYDDELTAGSGGRLERPAAETTAAALRWLSAAAEPWFLWIHYYDPHDPYTPPAPFSSSDPRRAYEGEVRAVDRAIGRVRRGLASGLQGRVLTLFTADHGESLGEHGEQTHGFFIYDSTVTVPLVVHFPGRVAPGASALGARLVDLAPTVLELLGQPPLAPDLDGVSLAGLLTGGETSVPPAYLESRRPWSSYGWAPLRAIRQDAWKLIAAPRPELYDLSSDPGETKNLLDQRRGIARRLVAALRRIEERPAVTADSLGEPEAMARLRALGYVGAGAEPGEPPPGLADPKDRLQLWNRLSEAVALLEARRYPEAVARFDIVLAQEPGNPFALSRSGAALLAAGQVAAAIPRLRRAARASPADPETRNALATALSHTGADAEAIAEWMELARLQPRRTAAWINLATVLGRGGKIPEAVRALERAVELAPERADLTRRLAVARFDLARREAVAGDLTAARRHLDLALRAAPQLRPQAEADPTLAELLR